MNFHEFADKTELAAHLAAHIAEQLTARMKSSEARVRLLLSGGSTPAPAYTNLANKEVIWPRLDVGLVDDRWVDESHSASNAALIRRSFLEAGAHAAQFTPMKTVHHVPADAVSEVNARYERFSDPDIVVLGMGPDGHTASWFPNSRGLARAMSPETREVVASIDATGSDVAGVVPLRMTLTLPPLVRADQVYLLITGDEKKKVLEDAAANLPIHQLIAARDNNMEVFWSP